MDSVLYLYLLSFTIKMLVRETSLVVQWLRLCAPTVGGMVVGDLRSRVLCGAAKKYINKK